MLKSSTLPSSAEAMSGGDAKTVEATNVVTKSRRPPVACSAVLFTGVSDDDVKAVAAPRILKRKIKREYMVTVLKQLTSRVSQCEGGLYGMQLLRW